MAVEWRQRLQLLAEDPSLKVPDGIPYLVSHMLPSANTEDLVELLEGKGLRLGHEQQDQEPQDDTPGRVPAKAPLRLEHGQHARPSEGDDEVEAPRGRRRPRHAHVPDVHGERLGAVGEGDGALAGGVEHLEEVHARRDHGDLGAVARGEEGHARPEEEDGQEREGEEQEVAAAPAVDCEEGGDGEHPVQDAGAHGGEESGIGRVARLDEDGGAVVGDDVHAAELLAEHDDPGGQGRSPVAGHAEELEELREEVLPLVDLALKLDADVCVVAVACRLDVGESKPLEGMERFGDLVVLYIPPVTREVRNGRVKGTTWARARGVEDWLT